MIENYANNNGLVDQEQINHSIINQGFSESTILLIDNFTNDILNGKSNLTKFNQKEHAGLCCASEVLIGAYVVCNYARTSLTTSGDAFEGKRNVPNWEIDELQEKLVQEWVESKQIWFPNAEEEIESVYGSVIAQGAEAKVYYKDNEKSMR